MTEYQQVSSKPIRVLQFLPSLAKSAGMVNVILNYYKHMDLNKVHMDFIYLNEVEPSFRAELEARGSLCCQVSIQKKEGVSTLKEFFGKHIGQYDILHCHPIFGPELLGGMAKRAGIKRVIVHSHSSRFSEKKVSAIRNRLLSTFVGFFATDYFACSDSARVLLGNRGKDAYLVRNAIDCEKYSFKAEYRREIRDELGIENDTWFIGTLGRLSYEKNQKFMIDLVAELRKRGHKVKLGIAGDGDLLPDLQSSVREMRLEDDVLLLGSRNDGEKLYSAFDMFLLTSLFEGLPVSAVEAQCSGLPCLLSDSITKEVAFGAVKYLPLDNQGEWIQAIVQQMKLDKPERSRAYLCVSENGYGIGEQAIRLQNKYQAIVQDAY